jgi:Uma2 family endonuclease
MTAFTIDLSPIVTLNPRQFEHTATGELVLMSPTGGKTGRTNAELSADVVIWNWSLD